MNTLPIMASAIIAFAATLSAGIFIRKFKSNIGIVCAFSAGFFIALSLFDIMPSILLFASASQISLDYLIFTGVVGFFFLFAFDIAFSKFHLNDHNMTKNNLQPRIGLLSTIEFCSHGFIEGLAIGVSFQVQFGLGIFVAIAVISHDFCDGLSTLTLMLNSGNSLKSSLRMLFIDAIAPVIGAVTTFFFSIENYFLIFMLSFLAGNFLYIGGGNLLPDAYRMNRPSVTVLLFLIGFFLVVVFTRISI